MKLTPKEQEVISLLRNITHENEERINGVLLGLMTHTLLAYAEGEAITIPYFGTFLIKYKGDKITPKGREAILESFFDPSPYLRENIGSYEDFKNSSDKNISSIPIISLLENENKKALRDTLSDTFVPRDDNE